MVVIYKYRVQSTEYLLIVPTPAAPRRAEKYNAEYLFMSRMHSHTLICM